MIVKMKEILLFALASRENETIQKLGEIGVVDIKEISRASGDTINRRMKDIEEAQKAIAILREHKGTNKSEPDRLKYNFKDPKRLVGRLLRSQDLKKQVERRLDELHSQLDFYSTWGKGVRAKDIAYLARHGIYVRLYRIDPDQFASLSSEHRLVAFEEKDGELPVVLIARDESEQLEFPEDRLPNLPVDRVRQQIERKERQLQEIDNYLGDQTENLVPLHDYLDLLNDRLGAQQALTSMGEIEGRIKYLSGYIPTDAVDDFVEIAQEQNWGYRISEPEKPEEVPVYVRNPKWISIINPVMKFIDIVPGYKEVDVSIYFLIAFALFFAMLVGDAGYGLIFLVLTFVFRRKIPGQMQALSYVLSGATIVWGVLSGTYFGSEAIAAIPQLDRLRIDEISSFGVDNISFMMHLSFLIGAIHLTIAHGIRFFQFINSIRALSEIGWIAFVWTLFFVAENLVIGSPMPPWILWVFLGGLVLVTFFSLESKGLVRSMAVSLANLPLSLINGFSDIVSYVRLFAVGLATATVAASFNDMILPSDGGGMSFIGIILAALALLVGHGLNIVLALMAVMVHGIRLNMLEFAGHVGIQFSGEAYRPFKLISLNSDGGDESLTVDN